MYPDFEKQAMADKAPEAIRLFGNLKKVEEKHEERYIIIAHKLDSKTLYDSEAELEWKCVNCGNIYRGKYAGKMPGMPEAALLVYATGIGEMIDFILNIDVHLGELIGQYGVLTYGILFGIIFVETGLVFTPFLPGDSLLFVTGAFATIGSL